MPLVCLRKPAQLREGQRKGRRGWARSVADAASSPMAEESEQGLALPADKVLALACISLAALSLSLLGSGSVLAVAVRQRRCCRDQLRPLLLLSLADFLGAAVLISAVAVHLLPSHLFGAAHGFCLYGLVFGMMFYAISLLMVLVYACEVNWVVRGWRVTQCSYMQESSSCFPRFQLALPYALAWLLPCLVVLALLVLCSGSLRGVALLQPSPQPGNDSGGSNHSCSSCLILIHLSQDTCYEHSGKGGNIFFLVFVALVVSGCMVLYCRMKSWQCWGHNTLWSDSLTSRSHVTLNFQLVLVLCWMPACLLVVLLFAGLQLSSLFPLLVATALTAPLQGFLHSLAYGWLRGNFRQEVARERLPLHCSPGLKAFYDDSLARSG